MKFADLHLHTHFSDGTFSPEELSLRAREAGLSTVALTDHDTLEGCPRMREACAKEGLEFVPGTELTADTAGQEVHVLGYWIDENSPALQSELARFQKVRHTRIEEMVARLNACGVPLRAETVFEIARCNSPGRPHLARALVEGGYANDFDHAFDRFLKKGRAAWVPKARMKAADAIRLIHDAGGAAVLAHPGLYRNDGIIPRLAAEGLDGVECWHTKHSGEASANYVRIATSLNLATTGGSDCHGMAKGQPLVGTVRIPTAHVEAIHARRPSRLPAAP
ncbi:MAG: PHP domain-containing protein [Verrucomicrobia bacterium]|nr:MAG: PHP domain-containing protein [Verrucomicrobiota bacterium]